MTASLRMVLFVGMMNRLQATLRDTLQDQEKLDRLITRGWLLPGMTALTPMWPYMRWDAAAQKQVPSDLPPLSYETALNCVEALGKV